MEHVPLILEVFAFVLFFLAAVPIAEPYRTRLIPAGLACWVLAAIVSGFHLA